MAVAGLTKNVKITKLCAEEVPVGDFISNYLSKGVPVVISGLLDKWPAMHWTLDNLQEKVGNNEVYVRTNTNCENYRTGRRYNIRQSKFNDYINDIKADNARSKNSYLAVQNIKKAFPQLSDDIKIPPYVGKVHAGPFLWVARKGHYEYCHFDPDDGFLMMFSGTKQIRLFGCDMNHLYANDLGSHGRTIQAHVDCDDPNFETHPLFKNATCYHTMLGPGEILHIPAFWWHQVTSVEVAISVNIFYGDGGQNTYLTKIMQPPWWPSFSYWLLNIVEQNRGYESFPRILSRLPEVLNHFILKQWHEIIDEQQLDCLVQLILKHLNLTDLPERQTSEGKHPPPLQIRGLLWRGK